MIRLPRSPLMVGLAVGILVGLMVAVIRQSGRLEPWELTAYDWSLSLQPDQALAPTGSPIVLIGITEQDVHALGQWPLTDTVLAEVLKKLAEYQPRVIGVDIYRNFSVPPGREALEFVLTDHPNIIMVMKYGTETQAGVPALPILHEDQVGFNDLLLDSDGIVRRGLLFMDDGQRILYSFALRLALLYLKHDGIVPQPDQAHPEYLRLGRASFRPFESNDGGYVDADMRGYQILLDFIGAEKPFPSYSLSALLSGTIDPSAVRDKIVMVGVTAESVPDVFHTPYSSALVAEQRSIYGVVVHAHFAGQLLRAALGGRRPVQTASEREEVLWILLWALAGGAVGSIPRSTWQFLGFITVGFVLLGGLVQIVFLKGWWIPVVPPALSWLISAALVMAYVASQENRQRAFLMQLFSRHVSAEVAEAIWQQRDQFWDGSRPRSQKVLITVMFTDLEAFTTAAEKMDPQALMDWTNDYIEIMAQLITEHGGVVDDYFGDAIKANFGVPVPRTSEAQIRQDARNAMKCALAMEMEMRRLNALWQAENLPTVRMRVGIYTGHAVAGSQGSAQRLKYTTLGDTVNIAARLESFGKEAVESSFEDRFCRILIGQTTLQYVGDEFETQAIGEVALKGKQEKVKVYRLLGMKPSGKQVSGIRRTTMKCISLTATVSIFLLALATLFSTGATAEEQKKSAAQGEDKTKIAKPADVPIYKPPVRGVPGGRVGGGTRGDGQTFRLSVLAPSHTGQTIHEQPSVFWYLSKAISTPIEFTFVEPGVVPPLVETALQPPFQAGIHCVRLADFGVHLAPGKAYRWFVAFVVNSERRAKDILAGGTIERIEASSTLISKLAQAPKAEMSHVYAEAGLWYDAILAVSDLIDAAPSEPGFRKQRAALLDQVGLSDIALVDLGVKTLE